MRKPHITMRKGIWKIKRFRSTPERMLVPAREFVAKLNASFEHISDTLWGRK